jgi:UDP-N-acetylglucosamine 2-epimerase
VVSDSGGVQEEAPTLGKPLLVLRENTERPEVLRCGVGRLVGNSSARLEAMLEEARRDAGWAERVAHTPNPFGAGDAGERIAIAIERLLKGEGSAP